MKHRLFEEVTSFENLWKAALKALRSKKKTPEGARFYFDLDLELLQIQRELREGRYRPGPYHTFLIHDPKTREISAAPFRDRVVHHAITRVLEPLLEKAYIFESYACRRGKGPHKALNRAQKFCRQYEFYLKCDVRKFFYNVDHRVLKNFLTKKIQDQRLLSLIDVIIDNRPKGADPGKGLPIGNLTSQHFANLYLDKLDHEIKDEMGVKGYLRYMDDFCLFGREKSELWETLKCIDGFLKESLKLELKQAEIAPVKVGLPFLGWRIFPGLTRLQQPKWKRFKKSFLKRQREFVEGIISEEKLIHSVASLVGHIQQGNTLRLRRQFFTRYALEI